MFAWILDSVHDSTSPLWFSREVFQNLFAAFLGAVFSSLLIAPMTARWIAWENAKKWRPARRVALSEIEQAISTLTNTFHNINYLTLPDPADEADELQFLTFCYLGYKCIIESYDELKTAYANWSEIWSVEQNSAIIATLEMTNKFAFEQHFSLEIMHLKRTVEYLENKSDKQANTNAEKTFAMLLNEKELPFLSVQDVSNHLKQISDSTRDKLLAAIFDECRDTISDCSQSRIVQVIKLEREVMMKTLRDHLATGVSVVGSSINDQPA